jgi:hypothetical protein
MTLRRELTSLNPSLMEVAFDGAFDKCASFDESGVMVDQLADDFPALAALVRRMQARIGEELAGEASRAYVVLGGALALMALVEHAHAVEMRLQFPDAPAGGADSAPAGAGV